MEREISGDSSPGYPKVGGQKDNEVLPGGWEGMDSEVWRGEPGMRGLEGSGTHVSRAE